MNRTFVIIALICLSSQLLKAQGTTKKSDESAAHFTKMLTKRLNLTTDQAQQINAIYLTQATRFDSLKANPSQNQRLNRLTMRSITLSTRQHVMAILNDTQKQEYTQWEEGLKERQKARRDTIGEKQ